MLDAKWDRTDSLDIGVISSSCLIIVWLVSLYTIILRYGRNLKTSEFIYHLYMLWNNVA